MSDAVVNDGEAAVGMLPGWDLNDLYPGPESSELKQDLAAVRASAEAFESRYAGRLAEIDGSGHGSGDAIAEYEAIVSKRPIWLVEAACLSMALPPTIQRRRDPRPCRQGARKRTRNCPSFASLSCRHLTPASSSSVGEQPGIRGRTGNSRVPEGTPVSIHPSGVPYPPLHV